MTGLLTFPLIQTLFVFLLRNLPVGWRFQPTNEQLLDYYLKNKRRGLPIHGSDIDDIQIWDFDPWDLIDRNSHYKERYLFCRPQFHKTTGGVQRKRKAKAGHWKRTGEIQSITREDGDEVIGTKTIFVYHNPTPTEFVKHEFELCSSVQDDNDFVLCKLMIIKKKKAIRKPKKVASLSEKKEATNSKKIEVDCNSNKPNKKARKGLSDCDPASVSVSDNQMQIVADSAYGGAETSNHITADFKYQSPDYSRTYSACVDGKAISHLTLDSENQTPTMMTPTSTVVNGESSHQGACNSECRNEYEMNNTSIYNKYPTMSPMDSDLRNQNPQEIGDVSGYSMSVTSSQMVADLENQIPNDMNAISLHEITAVSTHRTVETSSLTNFVFENSNHNERIADFSCKEGERSYPVALGFGNKKPVKETNVSASLEGRWSPLQETPLDFGKQNQYEKNDMSETEYDLSILLDSFVLDTDFDEVVSPCVGTDTFNLEDLGENISSEKL